MVTVLIEMSLNKNVNFSGKDSNKQKLLIKA